MRRAHLFRRWHRFRAGPSSALPAVALVIGLGTTVVACGDEPPERGSDPAGVAVRDSAGVEIMLAEMPGEGAAASWRIEPEAFLTIGLVEGDEPYLFNSVQLAGRLPDGRIFVVDDSPNRQIRTFDENGRFVAAWGRPGDGPGEFAQDIRTMFPYRGDSLAVVEYLGRRIHVFDGGGRFGRVVRPAYAWQTPRERLPLEACCRPALALPDGSWVAQYPELSPAPGSGSGRGEVRLVRLSPYGELIGEIGSFPGRLWGRAQDGSSSSITPLPLTGHLSLALRGDRILVGNGAEYRVDEMDADGSMVRSIRVTRNPPAAGLPAYGSILVDPEERIWLVSPVDPSAGAPGHRALVLAPSGHVLGAVTFPPEVWPMAVGRNEVFALRSDALGVQQVVVHRIVR